MLELWSSTWPRVEGVMSGLRQNVRLLWQIESFRKKMPAKTVRQSAKFSKDDRRVGGGFSGPRGGDTGDVRRFAVRDLEVGLRELHTLPNRLRGPM